MPLRGGAPVGGLACLEVEAGLLGPKKVEGFMRGYDVNEGGGTPEGKV